MLEKHQAAAMQTQLLWKPAPASARYAAHLCTRGLGGEYILVSLLVGGAEATVGGAEDPPAAEGAALALALRMLAGLDQPSRCTG